MAFGDYDGPNKPNKGKEGGACNRTRCQAEPASHYNHGSYSWYCADCARDIGEDVVNKRGWERDWQPRVGHPQFETRQQMDVRTSQMWAIYCEADNTLCWNRERGWVGEGDTFDLFHDHERRGFALPPGGAWRVWA